jgi:glycosyltransferase involved in cell wall biosynthesis
MAHPVDLCLIAEYFHPVLSGASERFRRYLPGLRDRGINVRVITIWQEGLKRQELIEGGVIYRLELPASTLHPSAELTKQTLRYFRSTGEWPEVVHVLSHTLQGIPYLWQMRLHGTACINSITIDPVPRDSSLYGKVNFWLQQWLRYEVFNQVITSSHVVAQSAQRCGIPARRINIIANGADSHRFHPVENGLLKQALRQKLGFSDQDKIVLFVGIISQRKGVDLLLQAWPQINIEHPQAKLVLIGPKDRKGQFLAIFDEMMRSLAAYPIKYLEPVENIETYMQAADILVLPSRLEGMPNVVVEGMACGLPCVLTPFHGLPETFGQPGEDYLLTSFEPAQIAVDINSLIADPVRRQGIGQAGLKRAQTVLNVETSLDLHAALYHYWADKHDSGRGLPPAERTKAV